jgi:hypothetical protein
MAPPTAPSPPPVLDELDSILPLEVIGFDWAALVLSQGNSIRLRQGKSFCGIRTGRDSQATSGRECNPKQSAP